MAQRGLGRQRLIAFCGSLTAVGGAFALQHLLKKRTKCGAGDEGSPVDTGPRRRRPSTGTKGRFSAPVEASRTALLKLKKETDCPGLAITVSVNGQTVWQEGFGFSDIENRVRCDSSSVMKIASVTKPITTALLAREWERQKLDLDKDVQQYVPYWPEKHWAGDKVILTPRQLCSHLACVRDYKKLTKDEGRSFKGTASEDFAYEEYYITKKYKSVEKSVGIFKEDPLICNPGSEFHYTTHGFTLLAAVLEGATNKKFTELIEGFLEELGLSNTFVDDAEKLRYSMSRHYVKRDDGVIQNAPFTEYSFKLAGAGLLSTTDDLVKFGNILLYSYQRKSQPFGYFKPSTIEMLWTPVANTQVSWDTKGRYGMGWQLLPGNGARHVGHTGGTVGASSALVISMDARGEGGEGGLKGVVVAILCNLQGVSLGKIAVEIGENFLRYS